MIGQNITITLTFIIISLLHLSINNSLASAASTKNVDNDDNQQYSKLYNDVEENGDNDVTFESDKRKWSSNNMGMWGKKRSELDLTPKRAWSSNKMAMWGRKKKSPKIENNGGNDDVINDGSSNDNYHNLDEKDLGENAEKREWASNYMGMWGKKRSQMMPPDNLHFPFYIISGNKRKWIDAGSWMNQPAIQQRRSKWGSGKMMMWGKRSKQGTFNSDDDVIPAPDDV
ncbi:hypothetical protein HELRODRAFT_168750 [Helobdella robusta]|uniref:Uncharacterized protein n=1 Tax=Helobdella robusta TaxID=6412 RepID=T1F0X3_HELRO|nr:hypothetical protein HELRODRAFT_168750 [Helobdella robusta]ESO08839.1 hypothetical protein HELRODRAFT_168750 [Helobdella robusta]